MTTPNAHLAPPVPEDPRATFRRLSGVMSALADELDGVALTPEEHAEYVEEAVELWVPLANLIRRERIL